jgi:hypothetical protein
MHIVSVDQMENGIVVNFQDGVCAFFDGAFLYTQMDKRVTDWDDKSSPPPRLKGNEQLVIVAGNMGQSWC